MCRRPAAGLPGAVQEEPPAAAERHASGKEAMGWLGGELLLKRDGFGQGALVGSTVAAPLPSAVF